MLNSERLKCRLVRLAREPSLRRSRSPDEGSPRLRSIAFQFAHVLLRVKLKAELFNQG